uniref:Immunoglobulin V-set domain-containing protein n=1 Tax=Amphilophus citrinellus TaxID=61819 RepID=A0A3Q0SFS0_AMPCI
SYFSAHSLTSSLKTFLSLGVSCDQLTAVKEEESSLEGTTVTLSYRLSRDANVNDCFFWYRQYPGKPPEFLLSYLGNGNLVKKEISRVTFEVVGDKQQMQISSAAVTDSANMVHLDSMSSASLGIL